MKKEIIISEQNDLAVVFDDGRASEFFLRSGDQLVGDIIWGQVEAVVPGIEAAFVNIGQDRNGFIHVADLPSAQTPRRQAAPKRPSIRVKERILVQIAKAPTGNKGARLTGRLTIPGRFLVLVPHDNRVSISRRIVEAGERDRLRRLTLKLKDPGHGVIVRTEAIGRSEEDLRQDIDELIDIWADILHQVQIVQPPSLLHRDSDLIHRVLRDAITADVSKIVIDTAIGHAKAQEILSGWMPELVPNVFQHRGSQSMLDRYRIRQELEAAISPKVWLPSGGYLVIEHTEALTVIDVNSGRLTQSRSLADTVLRTNMEAAAEVARQLRLRDIGGIIVIDFISMDHAGDRSKVLAAFHEALREDKSRPQVTGFSEHGLIEVSRRRQGQNLLEQLTSPCDNCGGTGRIRHSHLLPADEWENRPAEEELESASALVHEITDEPLATEIILADGAPPIEVPMTDEDEDDESVPAGEDGDDSEAGRRRRRRRRRGRGRAREGAAEPALGHMLTTTTPDDLSPEEEDEEGFLPPVMVPATPAPRQGRGRGRDRGDREVASPLPATARFDVEEAGLFDDGALVEEVALDLFSTPGTPSEAPFGGRDRGRGRDRNDRGPREDRPREDRGPREERPRFDRPREPRPAAFAAEGRPAAAAPAYDVSAPSPRTRRVERRGEAPAAEAPRPVREPARVAPPAAPAAREDRPAARPPVAPAPAASAPAARPAPADKPAVAANAPQREPVRKVEPLPLPETVEVAAVPGLFVLKKKDTPAAPAAPTAAETTETAKKAAPRRATTPRRATKQAAEVEAPAAPAEPAAKPRAAAKKAPAKAKSEPTAAPAAKKAPAKAAAAAPAKRATKAKAKE